MPDSRITLRFTGWKAIAVLLVALVAACVLAVRYFAPAATLPNSAQDAIKAALRFEYTQQLTARHGITAKTVPSSLTEYTFAAELAQLQQIEITEVKVRGLWRRRVAQFRVSVAGHAPPDNSLIRYMCLTRSSFGNTWTALPTAAPSFHLAFW